MSLEFTRYKDGTCALSDGDELLWSSDADDDYMEEFDAQIDSEDIDDVLSWLQDEGYIAPDESVDIVDESDAGTMSVDEDAGFYDDSDEDEDEEEGQWQH